MARGIAIKKVDGAGNVISTTHYTESVANTDFDTPIAAPSVRTPSPFAVRVRKPYSPQGKRIFTPDTQFPLDKVFHPNFKANFDYSGGISMQTLRRLGQNAFTTPMLTDAEKAALRYGEGVAYVTDGNIHGPLEGGLVQITNLQPYFNTIWPRLISAGKPGPDQGVKYIIFNIEQSVWLYPGNVGQDPLPGFTSGGNFNTSKTASWNNLKGTSIICEHTTRTITLETLASEGQASWEAEMQTRFQNRMRLMMLAAKEKGAPGTMVCYGTALYQGLPDLQFRNTATLPIPGSCDVSRIGGSSGSITLSKPGGGTGTYLLTGNFWQVEDFHLDYFYDMTFDLSAADFQDIFVNKLSGTQNYVYLWSKTRPFHTGAADKAHWQQIRYRMSHVSGLSTIPIWRMFEGVFEDNIACVVNGVKSAGRISFPELQAGVNGITATPKIMRPPVRFYNSFLWSRFLSGGIPNSGCRLFPMDFVKDKVDPATVPELNHHLHMFSTLWQARFDLLEEELFLESSTLIEDPDVKINAAGSWVNYDGMQAFNMDAGNYHYADPNDPLSGFKPCYSLRFKLLGNGDIMGLGIGSHAQWQTTERTDLLRAPGGTLLNGCSLRVKLRGESAHLFKFYIPSGMSNTEIACTPVATPTREMPGYGGWTNQFTI